jgi:hypothetical protein
VRGSGPSSGTVVTNLAGLVYGPLSVELGFGVSPNASLALRGVRWDSVPLETGSTSAVGLGAGVQLFAVGPLYDGVFVYPSATWLWAANAEGDTEPSVDALIALETLFGYEWDWKALCLRLGLGANVLVERGTSGTTVHNPGLALDLSAGLTF